MTFSAHFSILPTSADAKSQFSSTGLQTLTNIDNKLYCNSNEFPNLLFYPLWRKTSSLGRTVNSVFT